MVITNSFAFLKICLMILVNATFLLSKIKTLLPMFSNPHNVNCILLITSFRSGSTFLGDLLQYSSPNSTFYHFEPLHYMTNGVRMKDASLSEAINLIQNLFLCNFNNLHYYTKWLSLPGNRHLLEYNRILWNLCYKQFELVDACDHPKVLTELCQRSSIQVMKVTRMSMKQVLELLTEVTSPQLQIVYLQRDPRAIYSSRKDLDWCQNSSCSDIDKMCHELREDFTILRHFPKATVVRFEDLALHPERVTKQLFDKLKLNYTKNVENFLKLHTSAAMDIAADRYSTKRNSTAIVNLWQRKLSETDILNVQNRCKDVIVNMNYTLLVK
jgi:hypothetical protein